MFWFIGRQRSWQNHFLQVKQYFNVPNKRAHLHAYFPLHSLIFDPKHAGIPMPRNNKFKMYKSKDPEVWQYITSVPLKRIVTCICFLEYLDE